MSAVAAIARPRKTGEGESGEPTVERAPKLLAVGGILAALGVAAC